MSANLSFRGFDSKQNGSVISPWNYQYHLFSTYIQYIIYLLPHLTFSKFSDQLWMFLSIDCLDTNLFQYIISIFHCFNYLPLLLYLLKNRWGKFMRDLQVHGARSFI